MKLKPITKRDKAKVLEISSQIWGGDDYIHLVFDDWISDKIGEFTGVWENEFLIGFGKLTFITATDVWLEGLRKNPQTNVKGVGEALTKYFLQKLKRNKNISSIRFSTYFGNIPSIRINEKLGFVKIGTFSLKYLKVSDKVKSIPEKSKFKANLDSILKFIQKKIRRKSI